MAATTHPVHGAHGAGGEEKEGVMAARGGEPGRSFKLREIVLPSESWNYMYLVVL